MTAGMLSVMTVRVRLLAASSEKFVYLSQVHVPKSRDNELAPQPGAVQISPPRARREVKRQHRATSLTPSSSISRPISPGLSDQPTTIERAEPPPGPALRIDVRAALRAEHRGNDPISDLGIPPENILGPRPIGILERQTKLASAIERARRPDCRHAYAGLGLFALPFLVYDTVMDTGCAW